MIPRILLLAVALELFLVSTVPQAQNSRSYDTNEWIPISPQTTSSKVSASSTEEPPKPKKAQGRVLNLDAPAQKFFPEEEYRYHKRRPIHSGYQKQKDRYNLEHGYKFELPPPPSGTLKGPPKYQYFTNQEVKLPMYEQPPPLEQYTLQRQPSFVNQQLVPQQIHQPQLVMQKPLLTPPVVAQTSVPQVLRLPTERVPLPNAPNSYQLYNLPFNNSFYQSLNPGAINQELLGAIQHQNFEVAARDVPNVPVKDDKESVQLVYVPLENLKPKQPLSQGSHAIYKQVASPVNTSPTSVIKNHRLTDIQNDFIQQALQAHKLQEQIQLGQPILLEKSTTTTHKPSKKRKPHQPPLAVYVEADKSTDIADVVEALKEAKTISVQDNIHPGSPEIFIGPSTLTAIEGYTKFPLPYLNSLDGKRVDRKVDDLPFFVAPLSFKPPPGYSKIPLPSPHVGSVVISNRDDKKLTTKQIYTTPKPSVDTTAYGQIVDNQYYQSNRQQYAAFPNEHMLQFTVNKDAEQLTVPAMNHIQQQQQNTKPYQQPLTGETYYTGTHVVNVPKTQKFKQHHGTGTKNQIYDSLYQTTPRHAVNSAKTINNEYNTPLKTESYAQIENNRYTAPSSNQQQYENFPATEYTASPTPTVTTTTRPTYSSVSVDFVPIKPTAETDKSPEQIINNFFSENQKKKEIIDINPLELAINQFELHQINSQLVEKPRVKDQAYYTPEVSDNGKENSQEILKYELNYEPQTTRPKQREQYNFNADLHRFVSTPATILRDLDVQTTVHTTQKPRRRSRPSRPQTTTAPNIEKETYTVLEEFSAKEPNNLQDDNLRSTYDVQTTQNYGTLDKIIRNTYNNGQTTSAEYPSTVISNQQYSVNKSTIKYQETPAQPEVVDAYSDKKLTNDEIDNARRQNIANYETSTQREPNYSQQYKEYETSTQYEQRPYFEPYNEQNADRNRDHEQVIQQYQRQPYFDQQKKDQQQVRQYYQTGSVQYDNDPSTQPLAHNRGQQQQQAQQPLQEANQNRYGDLEDISEYISSLQDQSVRSLLVPNLLVPTLAGGSRTHFTPEPFVEDVVVASTSTTTTTTTTEAPETTTQGRTRGRQRGGNRFSNAATTTRRPIVRRRPTSRFTTERSRQTTEPSDLQRTATKQRFRTRGRLTPNAAAERLSTTENEIHDGPTSEAALRYATHPEDAQSYMQFEHTVSDVSQPNDYQRVYLSQQPTGLDNVRPVFQYENTAALTTPKAIVDIQITHPIEENVKFSPINRPKAEVYQSRLETNANHRVEETTKHPVKIRVRPRIKSKFSTTTETPITRRPVKESSEREEYFGFIRQPNFNQPQTYQTQVASATYQPSTVYTHQDNYYDSPNKYDNTEVETTTVRFIGELRPKYQSTTPLYETTVAPETEPPKPIKRQRIRTSPQRKANHRHSQEEISTKTTAQPHRKANVIRSRGRVQYKAPVDPKQPTDEGADVVGGNYPVNFLANRPSSTAAPSFKITVDPQDADEEDQSPYSSIYRPRIVPGPEEWHEASAYSISNEGIDNKLFERETEENDAEETATKVTTTTSSTPDEPIALPVRSSTEQTDSKSSEESYNQNTKAIEDQFEAVNNFDKHVELTEDSDKSRRRGVWKLVRHRPVDKYEVAESQNYLSVLNSFDGIKKINKDRNEETAAKQESYVNYNPSLEQNSAIFDYESHKVHTEPSVVTQKLSSDNYFDDFSQIGTEKDESIETTVIPNPDAQSSNGGDFFDSIYDMFGLDEQHIEVTANTSSSDEDAVNPTTIIVPTFPEEITETQDSSYKHLPSGSAEIEVTTLTHPTSTETPRRIATQTYSSKIKSIFGVEPWQMRAVRTSTSTEVSHETEICYKGRCVKSQDKKTRS